MNEQWKNRIVEVRQVRIGDILPHPHNPRTHSASQLDPLRGHLGETGKTRIPMAYYSARNGGRLTFHDGHGRQMLNPDEVWTVGITDLTDAEADLDIAVGDPLAALAGTDAAMLDTLLRDVSTGDAALQALLDQLAQDAGVVPDIEIPEAPPQQEPDLRGDRFIEIYCSDADLEDFRAVLDEWSKRKTVTVSIS